MVYNEKIKESQYKWREANKEQYKQYVRKGVKKYYEEHKDELNAKTLARYYHRKELKAFMNILL